MAGNASATWPPASSPALRKFLRQAQGDTRTRRDQRHALAGRANRQQIVVAERVGDREVAAFLLQGFKARANGFRPRTMTG